VIDYSVPSFTFEVGSWDASEFLDEISLRLPHHEPSRVLTWAGDFQVSRNIAAIAAGYTDSDFSEVGTPSRWRPGQQPVRLTIKGQTFPILRIEQYRWDPEARIGKGRLVQVLDLINADRPEIPKELGILYRPPLEINRGSVQDVINTLINVAIGAATTSITAQPVTGVGGYILNKTIPRNPISEAQTLLGLYWKWLACDTTEQIYSLDGDPKATAATFTRTDLDCEQRPNLEALQFASPLVIVSGTGWAPDKIPCADPPEAIPTADEKGRPTTQLTSSQKPFSEVFPGALSSGYNSTPTLAEQKTILYAYEDRRKLDQVLPIELQPDFNATIAETFGLGPNEPLFTATIKRQPFGFLFPDAGSNTTMVIGEAIVETPTSKAVWKPSGVLTGLDQSTTLILASREDLTSKYVPKEPVSSPIANPKTGSHTCFEPPPKKEPPQVAPLNPIKEVPVSAIAATKYPGWTPIISNPLIVNVGFLPNLEVATNLARQIARREERRRDSWLVKMPIPIEWCETGFRPLALCQIGGRNLQIDGPVIVLKAGGGNSPGEAYLEFEGGNLDAAFIEELQLVADIILEAHISIIDDEATPSATFPVVATILAEADVSIGTATELSVQASILAEADLSINTVTSLPVLATILTEAAILIAAVATPKTINTAGAGGLRALNTGKAITKIGGGQAVFAFKLNDTSEVQVLYEEYGPIPVAPGVAPRLQVYWDGSAFGCYTFGIAPTSVSFSGSATDWHELSIAISGGTATIQIDNSTATSVAYSLGGTSGDVDIYIGANSADPTFASTAKFAMFRLTSSIRAYSVYHCESLAGNEANLLALVQFREGTGAFAIDSVDNADLLELFGGATWGSDYTCPV
jgi:hypothetical protein